MALYPHVQEKVQSEIDGAVGEDVLPSYGHRQHLPYTEAVIAEMIRYATLVNTLTRAITETFTFKGYHFPKGAHLRYNILNAHRDPRVWDEPDRFQPERFLGPDGNLLKVKLEQVIQFGMGRY